MDTNIEDVTENGIPEEFRKNNVEVAQLLDALPQEGRYSGGENPPCDTRYLKHTYRTSRETLLVYADKQVGSGAIQRIEI